MKKTIPYLTVLRAISILGVILIHTLAQLQYAHSSPSRISLIVTLFLDQLARWCVPLFVMISGALVLKPTTDTLIHQLSRRFSRIAIPSTFWLIIYYFWVNRHGIVAPPKHYLIQTFVYGLPYYHLFYLFVIAGLYSLIPVLQHFSRHASQGLLRTTLWGIFVTTSSASLATRWFLHQDPRRLLLAPAQALPYIGYFLAGWYLHQHPPKLSRTFLWFVFCSSVIGGTLISVMFYLNLGATPQGLLATDYASPQVILMSLSLFSLAQTYLSSRSISDSIQQLAKASFGIYLIHPIIMELSLPLTKLIPTLSMSLPLSFTLTLFVSWAIVYVFSLVPGLRKTVGQ